MTASIQQVDQKATAHIPVVRNSDPLSFRAESRVQEEAFWAAMKSAQPYSSEKTVPFELTDGEWDAFWEAVNGE